MGWFVGCRYYGAQRFLRFRVDEQRLLKESESSRLCTWKAHSKASSFVDGIASRRIRKTVDIMHLQQQQCLDRSARKRALVFGMLVCSHHIANQESGARHRCMR